MTRITTHVLDTALGRPAAGLNVRLDRVDGGKTEEVTSARTDAEGRVRDWSPQLVAPGRYRWSSRPESGFARPGRESLYPEVVIHVNLADSEPHYHIPLLLAPFGYSTYRGT
jgi:5-hydroxyisourate hydrolase